MKTLLMAAVAAGLLAGVASSVAQELNLPPLDVVPGEVPVESQTLPPLEYEPDQIPSGEGDPIYESTDPAPEQTAPAPFDPAAPVEGVPAPDVKAERVKNRVAEFSGIDKITGRITSFDVEIDETVQFGALQVTPRVCYTSPPSAPPKTDSFVEVDEITLDREIRRIFTGWMFSDSPGLNAVEHPIYDVWLKSCKASSTAPPPAG